MTSSARASSAMSNVAIRSSFRVASANAADFRSLSISCTLLVSRSGEVDDSAADGVEGRPLPRSGERKVAPFGLYLGPVGLQRQRGPRAARADLVGQPVQPPQHLGLARLPQV